MKNALADRPIIPFRIPKGIRNVQINAETGARARIGDNRVIWEAFKVGKEPTDQMYILDGRGISAMPNLNDYLGDEFGSYDPNSNFDPDTSYEDSDMGLDDVYYNGNIIDDDNASQRVNDATSYRQQQVPNVVPRQAPSPVDTSGTGGLY